MLNFTPIWRKGKRYLITHFSSSLWDVLLAVTTYMLPTQKETVFGGDGEVQVWATDEAVRNRNVRHFCHFRKPSSSVSICQYLVLQRKQTNTCQTKQGNSMLWHHNPVSPWRSFLPWVTASLHPKPTQLVVLSDGPSTSPLPPHLPWAIAHGVQGTEICFSHTVLSPLPCPPCPHVLLGPQVAGEP